MRGVDVEGNGSEVGALRQRAAVRRAIVALIAAAFLADVVLGAVAPLFPLFAKRLGASTADLAALVTAGGLASLLAVIPAARLADRVGKPAVLSGGLALYGVSGVVLALGHAVALLAVPQLLMGIALVCTFTVGLACLSDLVSGPARARAVGFYTAAMGAGYGVGPLLSGLSASGIGYRSTFAAFGCLGVAAAATVWVNLLNLRKLPRASEVASEDQLSHAAAGAAVGWLRALRERRPSGFVLLASFVNLPTTLAINVGILTFFPVYAAALHWSTSVIGIVLFGRASASAVARLGMRVIDAMAISPLVLIRATLAVETCVLVLVAWSRSLPVTVLLLAIEGVNYGITMSLAQLSIVSSADRGSSASSLVWWNAASSVAQLGGGGLVAVLVGGYSARTAIVIVALICGALWLTFLGLSAWRGARQRRAAPTGSSGPWSADGSGAYASSGAS